MEKITLSLKQTFHEAVREAVHYRDRWHMPAKIWLINDPGTLSFEAHPDTVRPGGSDAQILLELSADQLAGLARLLDTPQWGTEVDWLLDRALAHA